MHSSVLQVLERRRFDWSYLVSGQQEVVIQPAISVADFYHVQLWIRIHALSFSAAQIVGVSLFDTLPSDDDPREFVKTSAAFASTSFTSSPGSPALLSASGTGPGAYLKLLLTGYQDNASPGIFYVELSMALVLRRST
jgi:hypothetical protein